jgi:hypothetical protein
MSARQATSADGPSRDSRGLSPLARELFVWAREQTPEAQRYLFDAASEVLGTRRTVEQSLTLEAARQCERELGRTVSEEVYRLWWLTSDADSETPIPWPTAWQAKVAFGGRWGPIHEALYASKGTPRASIKATVLFGLGRCLSNEELIAGLQRWWTTLPTDDTRVIKFDAYRAWAIAQQSGVMPTDPRLAISFGPFVQRYGSWYEALAAAGLADHLTAAELRQQSIGRGDRSDEALLGVVRDADADARARGVRLTRVELDAYVTGLREAQISRGELATWPDPQTILRRFGGLTRSLERAGLISPEEAAKRGLRRKRYVSLSELAQRVTDAALAIADEQDQAPENLRSGQYRNWRPREVGKGRWAPSSTCLTKRFEVRTFREVVKRCLAMAGPQDARLHDRAAKASRAQRPGRPATARGRKS